MAAHERFWEWLAWSVLGATIAYVGILIGSSFAERGPPIISIAMLRTAFGDGSLFLVSVGFCAGGLEVIISNWDKVKTNKSAKVVVGLTVFVAFVAALAFGSARVAVTRELAVGDAIVSAQHPGRSSSAGRAERRRVESERYDKLIRELTAIPTSAVDWTEQQADILSKFVQEVRDQQPSRTRADETAALSAVVLLAATVLVGRLMWVMH